MVYGISIMYFNWTPLIYATFYGHIKIVELLLLQKDKIKLYPKDVFNIKLFHAILNSMMLMN